MPELLTLRKLAMRLNMPVETLNRRIKGINLKKKGTIKPDEKKMSGNFQCHLYDPARVPEIRLILKRNKPKLGRPRDKKK